MTETFKVIEDKTNDEVSKLLIKLNNVPNWTAEKQSILKELLLLLEYMDYKMLILKEHRYKVGKVGNSFIYEVAENRRGLFAPFRGKSVRVVCIASGRFDRTVMVKAI